MEVSEATPKAFEHEAVFERFNQFVDQGVELVRQGRFQSASSLLRSEEMAREIGVRYDRHPTGVIVIKPPGEKDAESIVSAQALFSNFDHGYKATREEPLIVLSPISFSDEARKGTRGEILRRIQQNEALVFLEEWLHAKQWREGKPLCGQEDSEIDVAIYMRNKGIELTPEFLNRHGRAAVLTKTKAR